MHPSHSLTMAPAPPSPSKIKKIRYFAYGSNMNMEQIQRRCSRPTVIGPARLPAHALAFHGHTWLWDGGMETVIPAPGHDLWGVLYELSPTDSDSLDCWQDVKLNGTGDYFHSPVTVFETNGEASYAVIYKKDILGEPKAPSRELLAFIVLGAHSQGLPETYVTELERMPSTKATYPVPRSRDEDRDDLRTTSCPDCTSLLDDQGRLIVTDGADT